MILSWSAPIYPSWASCFISTLWKVFFQCFEFISWFRAPPGNTSSRIASSQGSRLAFGKNVFCWDGSVVPTPPEKQDTRYWNGSYVLIDGRLWPKALWIQHFSLMKAEKFFHPKSPQNQIFTRRTCVQSCRVNRDEVMWSGVQGPRREFTCFVPRCVFSFLRGVREVV